MKNHPLTTLLLALALPASLYAEDPAGGGGDSTGTNPINFTNDLRLYNEYQWLDTGGDGSLNLTTLEFRTPFADGKWQFRTRLRASALDIGSVDEFGFGDMDFRLLTVPYLNMQKKVALATGIEFGLPTGSGLLTNDAITAGPQVFGVFFKPFGGFFDLIAPAYQHKFSVYEEDDAAQIHQGLFDLFLLRTSADKSKWALINPQAVIDYENGRQFGLIEAEVGMMLDPLLGTKGHSMYVRPSYGLGDDRPYDFSLEAGYKIVW